MVIFFVLNQLLNMRNDLSNIEDSKRDSDDARLSKIIP